MSRRCFGLHVRWPWSSLIIEGKKNVETRSYPIPQKHIGVPLAIIETAGKKGKNKSSGVAKIVGVVTFSGCIQYKTRKQWLLDFHRHQVSVNDPEFSFDPKKEKWGWIICKVEKISPPKPAPKKRGIVFASNCEI